MDLCDEKENVCEIIRKAEEATGETAKLESTPAFLNCLVEGLREKYGISQDKAQKMVERSSNRAAQRTNRDTQQAMEGFVHNLNTMHSRAGAQTPFSSINYGTAFRSWPLWSIPIMLPLATR